ncbi:MAG: DUF2059 domain-containing protein [Pseudomonadota bacterium]
MRKPAAALLLAWSAALAHAAPPTAESVEALLAVTQARDMVEQVNKSLEGYIRQGVQAAVGGKPLTPRQRQALDALPAKLVAAMQPELGWDVLKADLVRVYEESFSQEEIDGMIAFYRSPVGRSITAKMPTVMNRSMQLTQARMAATLPRLQAALAAAVADVKADAQAEEAPTPQP